MRQVTIFMHKNCNDPLPGSLWDLFTSCNVVSQEVQDPLITVPPILGATKRNFLQGSLLWNNLDPVIQSLDTLAIFKSALLSADRHL